PAGQQCCGALHLHNGSAEPGRDLARRNVDAFEAAGVDVVVNNAAGCGAALKNYAHILADDPAYADRARAFTDRVRDVNELLAEGDSAPPLGPVPLRVTYQDACHLAHGQGIRRQPRQLLRAIPGLELIEMAGSDTCCGSAGIYNVLEPDLAEAILDGKVDAIRATGAEAVVVSNPGCLIQIAYGLRRRGHPEIPVYHPMDLLARAYRGRPSERMSRPRSAGSVQDRLEAG
ncbi:MAG TPA: (Fe-S)-binding protein, partial [Dehalococcoidia bacterium]|nr:(Fe-S)-binding protein [Dehalococcoidia bacterium]